MKNHLNSLYILNAKCIKSINPLTFIIKGRIFKANAKTFYFETDHMVEWKRSGINYIYFFKIKALYCGLFRRPFAGCDRSPVKVFPKGNPRREECLKSKMVEKYTLSITMIACQIEKWHRFIRHWSLLKFSPYFQLMQVRIKPMILLKREVS